MTAYWAIILPTVGVQVFLNVLTLSNPWKASPLRGCIIDLSCLCYLKVHPRTPKVGKLMAQKPLERAQKAIIHTSGVQVGICG